MRHSLRHLAFASLCASMVFAASTSRAATVVIQNNDGAGEGFKDATVVAPVGGNPGTTLGAQRLNAFTYAANLWAANLQSSVTITVAAQMNPLTCGASSAILGSAGTTTVHRNFAGAPVANTWYCQALANSLAGVDLDGGNPDISATFNSNLNGSAGCLGGTKWYYGYDASPPAGTIDFVSVVVHEIGHGLGFQTFVTLASGAKFMGFNDTYMLKLNQSGAATPDYPSMSDAQRVTASTSDPNLRWTGANVTVYHPSIPLTSGLSGSFVRVHEPNPQVSGSSVSHFSTALIPNEIMEPSYTGANHNINLTLQLMSDVGWVLIPTCTPGTTTVNDTDTLTVTQTLTSWDLKVKVANTGAFPATGVNTSMTPGPGWLSVTEGVGVYPDLAAGASAFNTDTYTLNLTNWPGGPFNVNLQIFWNDDCGLPHNQTVVVALQPAPLVAVAISSFSARARQGTVQLDASFRSDLGAERVNVYRGAASGAMIRLAEATPESDRFQYVDATVAAGATYRYQIGVVDADGEFVSPVETVTVPRAATVLEQNHPNPFNPRTTIHFSLSAREQTRLSVYNADGVLVRTLVDGMRDVGSHAVDWDGRDERGASVSSGVYFYRLSAGKFAESKKMLLLK